LTVAYKSCPEMVLAKNHFTQNMPEGVFPTKKKARRKLVGARIVF
jgi:hypothetical protein